MSENSPIHDDKLMEGHEYDGIQELDNDLPPWWVMLFLFTIAFSVVYLAYYHVMGTGLSQTEAYEEEMKYWSDKGVTSSSGKSLFAINCMSCHGKNAQGTASIMAPHIAGQSDWYLTRQLNNYREDIRGAHPEDVPGGTMRSIAKVSLKSEYDVKAIVEYVAGLPQAELKATLTANAEEGAKKYKSICVACHGVNGEGNKVLNAPKLSGLNDWYILSQLENFKNGRRGAHANDIPGQTMVPMTLSLTEEDMRNLAVYILTLKK